MSSVRRFRVATIAGVVFVWLLTCGLLLLGLWPWYPTTFVQWLLFVVLAPLAWGAVEYLGGRMFPPELGARISSRRFSWLRIAYALCATLVFLGALLGVVLVLGRIIGGDA
jgi:hypothetical protein